MHSFYLTLSFIYLLHTIFSMWRSDARRAADPTVILDGYKLRKDGRKHGKPALTYSSVGRIILAMPYINILTILIILFIKLDKKKEA